MNNRATVEKEIEKIDLIEIVQDSFDKVKKIPYLSIVNKEKSDIMQDIILDNYFNTGNSKQENFNNLIRMFSYFIQGYEDRQKNSIKNEERGKLCNSCKDEVEDEKETYKRLYNETLELYNKLTSDFNKIEAGKNLLDRKVENMNAKLKNSLPIHSIIYLCFTTAVFVFALALYIVQFLYSLYIIHPYILFMSMIGSVVLFNTVRLGIKDWKEWLNNNE